MSWLNLNDSLNSLKGQITNFANNVLADEDEGRDVNNSTTEFEELQRLCSKQQEEINYLKKFNAGHSHGKSPLSFSQDDCNDTNEFWSWEVSDPNKESDKSKNLIANLKETITKLQAEKQELTSNLVLLDSEHQLNTEKLVNIKNKLQKEYNELEDKYNQIERENQSLIEVKKRNQQELDDLKVKFQSALDKNVGNTEMNHNETCLKCEKLLQENQKFGVEIEQLTNEIGVLKSNNATLSKILDDSKRSNEEECCQIQEKLKLHESENKILVAELKKTTQLIAEFEKKSEIDADNCKKLALILEGYEQQVSNLKQELLDKHSQCTEDVDKVKNDFEEVQKQLQQAINEKEQLHNKYVNILTENMKKYVDCNEEVKRLIDTETDSQVLEFNHQVESIVNILLDLKTKCESLEKELFNATEEKTKILSEKNHEIEKLLHNSEILSQEVITKSQTIKDYENECNELIKNNDMLINELNMLKNNSGLQTISESNEDNIVLLEAQLETANKKIEELESVISQKRNAEDTEETIAKSNYETLLGDFSRLEVENLNLKKTAKELERSHSLIAEERENLHSTVEKMKTDLENTEYQYTEININMEGLKDEVESHKKKIEELSGEKLLLEKHNMELERSNEDIRSKLNILREKLLIEEDTRKQCENQIRNLTEKLQNAKMNETSLKLQYDTINKELIGITEAKYAMEVSLNNCNQDLKECRERLREFQDKNEELNLTITELKNELINEKKKVAELTVNNKDAGYLRDETQSKDKDTFENINLLDHKENENDSLCRHEDLKSLYESVVAEKEALKVEIDKLSATINDHSDCTTNLNLLKKNIEELEATKNELTNVIITKHQESVTYHSEIQRLTQILNTEAEKNRTLEIQLNDLKMSVSDKTEVEKKTEEIDKLTDQNNFLRQKCEVLAQNLLEEQNRVHQIIADHSNASDKEQVLAKKLERLQTHLIEVEEHYTQELLRAEERNTELQAKVSEIEQREKNSSTMYTSVSIRANQHVETLQHQLQLITNQRDDLRKKISDAEDHASKQEAALANLQFVLEQFQKDREKDVHQETERIRRQITTEKKIQNDLKHEIATLQSQLEESKHGLLAASRLSDQLEQSKQLINTLKAEVSQQKEKLHKNEAELRSLSSQSDGKVDKSLIKNLIIGLVSTNNNLNKDQTQILKIIATVLDFNQQDHDKINLSKSQGWLGSLLNPQTSQGMTQESLSQAFVKFLENESKPRQVPSLLGNNDEVPKSRKTSVTASRNSPNVLSEVVLPTFADFAQNRNSSSILKDVLKDNS